MKRTAITAVLVALLMGGGLAFAQEPTQQQQNQQQNEQNTVMGTVVSINASELVVRDHNDDLRTFALEASTDKPESLARNDNVKVWFRPAEEMLADDIAVRIVDETDPAYAADAQADMQAEVTTQQQRDRDADLQDERDRAARDETASERSELPRTASRTPALALMGLLSLIGAAGLFIAAKSI